MTVQQFRETQSMTSGSNTINCAVRVKVRREEVRREEERRGEERRVEVRREERR